MVKTKFGHIEDAYMNEAIVKHPQLHTSF